MCKNAINLFCELPLLLLCEIDSVSLFKTCLKLHYFKIAFEDVATV